MDDVYKITHFDMNVSESTKIKVSHAWHFASTTFSASIWRPLISHHYQHD